MSAKISGSARDSGSEVWVVREEGRSGKGRKSKERAERLFKINAGNDAAIAEIHRLIVERERLDKQIEAAEKSLVTIEIPKEDA